VIKILEGQISFGGMQDALEAVARHKNIKHGIVQVTSNTCSGLMGVFCGRYITGAVLTLSGETGLPALRDLLAAKDGSFAFLDVTDEPIADLNQSLGVDLQAMLSSVDFSLDSMPVSEESLVGMASSNGEEIHLVDTSVADDGPVVHELTPERINATYQRITKISSHLRSQMPPTVAMEHVAPTEILPSLKADGTWNDSAAPPPWLEEATPPAPPRSEEGFFESPEDYERMRRKDQGVPKAVDISSQFVGLAVDENIDEPAEPDPEHMEAPRATPPRESLASPIAALNRPREERHSETGNFAVIYDAAPPTASQKKQTEDFKRLKDWKHKQRMIQLAVGSVVAIGLFGAAIAFGPQIMSTMNQPKAVVVPDADKVKVEPVKQEPIRNLPRRHRRHRN
jgi:hypothetical protein